jgi:hypothetical protein
MDLHRRRSVLVRMTESGEHLETVRIVNTDDRLADVMSRAGECPEVVLEATYGWYWAADTLAELGASVQTQSIEADAVLTSNLRPPFWRPSNYRLAAL